MRQVGIGFTAITQRGSREVDWGWLTRTEILLLAYWLVLIGAFWRVKRAGGFRARRRWYVKLPKWKRVMVVAGSGFVGLIVVIALAIALTWTFFSPE